MLEIKKNDITGNITMQGDKFGCTFFDGHLFPVFFTDPAGNPAGSTRWQDQLTDGDAVYTLRDERWAEFEVIKATADEFIIRTKGIFCGGNDRKFLLEYPGISIAMTWQFNSASNIIKLDIQIDGTPEKPVDLLLCAPEMRFKEDKNILFTESFSGSYSGSKLHLTREIEVKI